MSADRYLEELYREKDILERYDCAHSMRFLEEEINHVEACTKQKTKANIYENEMFVINEKSFREEMITISEKVLLPVDEFPRFNFIGKLMGPKGSTLKGIATSTKTKISVLGRGSTRDREKEDELIRSEDPLYEHLKEPLHILIEVKAPKSDAHGRLAAAFKELQSSLIPQNAERNGIYFGESEYTKHENEYGIQQPVFRYGIPPPGAIIIGEQPPGVGKQRH